eukprot:TRINITY_DN33587_c0_g1_i1.p1 TRINITY_DN33587_c0_g1~~TRINITY_DN33587_c0_g1_i1.p1  ORF type:complete len:384 (+),score=44.80 TRINITY_DN33587_c0_g1_i1:58-1152(+)
MARTCVGGCAPAGAAGAAVAARSCGGRQSDRTVAFAEVADQRSRPPRAAPGQDTHGPVKLVSKGVQATPGAEEGEDTSSMCSGEQQHPASAVAAARHADTALMCILRAPKVSGLTHHQINQHNALQRLTHPHVPAAAVGSATLDPSEGAGCVSAASEFASDVGGQDDDEEEEVFQSIQFRGLGRGLHSARPSTGQKLTRDALEQLSQEQPAVFLAHAPVQSMRSSRAGSNLGSKAVSFTISRGCMSLHGVSVASQRSDPADAAPSCSEAEPHSAAPEDEQVASRASGSMSPAIPEAHDGQTSPDVRRTAAAGPPRRTEWHEDAAAPHSDDAAGLSAAAAARRPVQVTGRRNSAPAAERCVHKGS